MSTELGGSLGGSQASNAVMDSTAAGALSSFASVLHKYHQRWMLCLTVSPRCVKLDTRGIAVEMGARGQ